MERSTLGPGTVVTVLPSTEIPNRMTNKLALFSILATSLFWQLTGCDREPRVQAVSGTRIVRLLTAETDRVWEYSINSGTKRTVNWRDLPAWTSGLALRHGDVLL